MCIIELTHDEIKTLKYLASLLEENPSTHPELFCKESKSISNFIPKRIKNLLINFANYGSETGYLLIKTINMDNISLPITPPKNSYKIGEKTELAKIQSILLHFFSEMIAYEAECYGSLFQDVVPVKDMKVVTVPKPITAEIDDEFGFSDTITNFPNA
jgi:hypothetical protein